MGKIHKLSLRFDTKTFWKYRVWTLSANTFEEKYTNSTKCCLYLGGKLNIFEKGLGSFMLLAQTSRVISVFYLKLLHCMIDI